MIVAVVTWPDVAMALVVALPAIVAAFYGHKNSRAMKTPNGKPLGEIVADVHDTIVPPKP